MVEATVALKNGEVRTEYASSFEELFDRLEKDEHEIAQVIGRTINIADMRQGKEKMTNGYSL